MSIEKEEIKESSTNRDPISGEKGAHPVGTGIGAASVGTAATVIGGVLGGPVGAVVGAVIGSVAGGLAGKEAAETINPTVEDEYWSNNYNTRPYVEEGRPYKDYQPAFKTGYEGYARYSQEGKTYDEVESDLQRDYETEASGLEWEKAKYATRDAWDRASSSYKS